MPPERAGEVIEREAHRLERLIRDLLDLARLRRRSFDVTLVPVDLGEVAGEALARHGHQAQAYGVGLELRVEPTAGAIADAGRALQALSNLVENAIRCTPKGGTVEIVAAPGRLAVLDDGPGLEPGDLGRAFERFYLWDRYGADRPVGLRARPRDRRRARRRHGRPGDRREHTRLGLDVHAGARAGAGAGPHGLRAAYAALKDGEQERHSVKGVITPRPGGQ